MSKPEIHYYLEYSTPEAKKAAVKAGKLRKREYGDHAGNAMAVFWKSYHMVQHSKSKVEIVYDSISSLFDTPNSECIFGTCSDGYLKKNCIKIPVDAARKIHPNLFKRLEL